jgi:hypothetical protein
MVSFKSYRTDAEIYVGIAKAVLATIIQLERSRVKTLGLSYVLGNE